LYTAVFWDGCELALANREEEDEQRPCLTADDTVTSVRGVTSAETLAVRILLSFPDATLMVLALR